MGSLGLRREIRDMLKSSKDTIDSFQSFKEKRLEDFFEIRDILKDFYKLETVVNGGNPVRLERKGDSAELYMPNEYECINNYARINPKDGDVILTIKSEGARIILCVDRLEFNYFYPETCDNKKLNIEDEKRIMGMLYFDIERAIYEKLKEYEDEGIVYSKAK